MAAYGLIWSTASRRYQAKTLLDNRRILN